jgi:hypothetical protein
MADIVPAYDQPAAVDVYMPAATVQMAMERRTVIANFVASVMVQGHDYGKVPGTQKPTLLKPGAEKLCNLFGLSPAFTATKEIEDWTGENHGGEMFFHYAYKCVLTRNGVVVGEGEGSYNSWEKKYRYRTVKDQRVPNPDIADQVNTLAKMAQKRALIAATLIACSASEFFTQDQEMDGGEERGNRPMPQRKGAPKLITKDEWDALGALASRKGLTAEETRQWLIANGADESKDFGGLTTQRYGELMETLGKFEGGAK